MKLSMVAPELRSAARMMSVPLPLGSKFARRAMNALLRRAAAKAATASTKEVTIEVIDTLSPALWIYTPTQRQSTGALLWIHGGGFLIGSPAQDRDFCMATASELGVVVVASGYRLSPDHSFPAPLDDCHAAWRWLQTAARSRGIDPKRIAIGGQSAGGGLAAALVQRVHDQDENKATAQWLFCPMLDDRTAARHELDAVGHRIWNNRLNRLGWGSFLGTEPGTSDLPPYASPARRTDLGGLPPAWIGVGEIDLFYDEDRDYAGRLRAAGIDTSFVTVPGAPHGFEAWAARTPTAQRFLANARQWLGHMLRR